MSGNFNTNFSIKEPNPIFIDPLSLSRQNEKLPGEINQNKIQNILQRSFEYHSQFIDNEQLKELDDYNISLNSPVDADKVKNYLALSQPNPLDPLNSTEELLENTGDEEFDVQDFDYDSILDDPSSQLNNDSEKEENIDTNSQQPENAIEDVTILNEQLSLLNTQSEKEDLLSEESQMGNTVTLQFELLRSDLISKSVQMYSTLIKKFMEEYKVVVSDEIRLSKIIEKEFEEIIDYHIQSNQFTAFDIDHLIGVDIGSRILDKAQQAHILNAISHDGKVILLTATQTANLKAQFEEFLSTYFATQNNSRVLIKDEKQEPDHKNQTKHEHKPIKADIIAVDQIDIHSSHKTEKKAGLIYDLIIQEIIREMNEEFEEAKAEDAKEEQLLNLHHLIVLKDVQSQELRREVVHIELLARQLLTYLNSFPINRT